MSKTLPIFILLLIAAFLNGQAQPVLYGLTSQGGRGGGVLLKFDPASNQLSTGYDWDLPGRNPETNDLVEHGGKLYGMTPSGGSSDFGTIFSFDPATNTHAKLFDFNGSNGSSPFGSLIDSGGKLYGMTSSGGSSGSGTIFYFDLATNTHAKLFDFNGTNGSEPRGSLFVLGGKLYGMTYTGGSNSSGTIFSFDPATNTHAKLFDFNGTNGSSPFGSLIDSGGKLYGMTSSGGSSGSGTIFSFDLATNTHAKLFDFNGGNGSSPRGKLLVSGGKLYGMTAFGGSGGSGTIFSFDPATNTHARLFDFGGTKGSIPYGSLVVSSGKLYGTTAIDATIGGFGTIFSFDLATSTHVRLFNFNGTNGSNPTGSLVESGGKLYGLTKSGGSSNNGTIFYFDPATNTHAKRFDFNNTNGIVPRGSLVVSGGKLYGTTSSGGSGLGYGTIFSFDPATNTHAKLFDFNNTNGNYPLGSLIVSGGKLYGMTSNGGSSGYGTLFSFDPATNTHSKLFDFNNINGSNPYGSFVVSGGKLYGMTSRGGSSGNGTIFSFDPATKTHTKIHDFNGNNGGSPTGSLVVSGGKLYGMTSRGGSSGNGTVFSFDPATNTYAKLFDFNNTNGSVPYGSLVESGGKLFGMTASGGSNFGTIFSFDPATNTHSKLFDFNNTNGSTPYGSLVESCGKLYGMTSDGGTFRLGTIFSFDPATNTFTKLQDFDGTNGANPQSGAFIVYNLNPQPPAISITAPANNSSFPAGSDITVTADAQNPGGSIAYVDFFELGGKLGSDSSFPYTFQGTDVPTGTYRVFAIAVTSTGNCARSDTITVNVTACAASGSILGEGYTNIPGAAVADLTSHPTYPASPSITASLPIFEYSNVGDDYGGRLRGFICAPVTGDYVFYISGDDQAGLWVSTDDNPANKQLLAYTTSFTGFRQWDKFSTQQSSPVRLVAGARYYVETLHKESLGEDHLSVGWRLPNGSLERPISGSRLSPFSTGGPTPTAAPSGNFEESMRARLNTSLQARVMPNPSRSNFSVYIEGKEGTTLQLTVTDIQGRIIEKRSNLQPNTIIQLGQNWKTGIYILQVMQGEDRKILKLIKE